MKCRMPVLMLAVLLLTGCAKHYEVVSVTRSRILIDSTYDAHPDVQAMAYIAPYKAIVDSIMSPVVGTAAKTLIADRPESPLSNLLADILLWEARQRGEQPAFAVYNMGGIRAALRQGDVTYGDVLEVAPFDNKICFLSLTGDKVLELFGQMAQVQGEGVSHGVQLVINKQGELLSARLNGKAIEPDSTYRVTTLDYLAQGNDFMTAFKAKTDYVAPSDSMNNVRFIIMDYFRNEAAQGKAVDADEEGRILVKTPY